MVTYQGNTAKDAAMRLAMQLRAANVRAVVTLDNRSLKSQLNQANREGVQFTLILGEQELAENKVTVKPMKGGEQVSVALGQVVEQIKGMLKQ
jgi:histidyl-tRNA synthetase